MKVLKIILISLVVLFVCLVAGLAIFIKTLDLNRYLPQITDQVAKATGRELKVGHAGLNLSLFKGVTLELKDLAMSDDARFSDKPFLTAGRVMLGVDLGAILGGKVVVTEVAIDAPKINIIRDKEGRINAAMIAPANVPDKPAASVKPGTPAPAAALPALLVRDFHVDGASLNYFDQMFTPPLAVTADKISIAVKDFSLSAPFDLTLKAAVFSAEQNVLVTGRIGLDLASLGVKVENMKLGLDFGKVALDDLMTSLPMLKPAGLNELKGTFSLDVTTALLNSAGLKTIKATAGLPDGRVVLSAFPVPVEKITLAIEGDDRIIAIKELSCALSGGTVQVHGTVSDYMTDPKADLTGTANGIEAKGISEALKTPVKASGKLAAEFHAAFSGKAPDEIMKSLDGNIKANMKEGSLEGINLLQTGLGNIPMLPGLLAAVQSSLPAETQADLEKGVTLIKSCDFEAKSTGGAFTIDKGDIVTRDISAQATGTGSLSGDISVLVKLYIEKILSESLVSKVKDLGGLRLEDGRIYIPLYVKGPLTKPQVQPDAEYLSKMLLMTRGKEELQKVLEKNPQVQGVLNAIFGSPSQNEAPSDQPAVSGGSEGSQVQPAEQGDQPSQGGTDANKAVNALFNAIFEKK